MRVVQCNEYGGPDVLHLAERPVPPIAPGKIRIRVHAAAVNPADVKLRQGMFDSVAPLKFPQVLGYDVAGIIDGLGDNVSGFFAGERVFAMLDMLQRGAYAEYVLVPAADVVLIPEPLDFATAVAIPTGGLTGVQMIEDYAQPRPGDSVLITGATGSVGRFAMFAARKHGAHIIAAVRQNQQDEARALGANEVLILGTAWHGSEFKYVIDTVGGDAVAALCRHLRADGGIFTAATTPINPAGLVSAPVFVVVHNDPAKLRELAGAVARPSSQYPSRSACRWIRPQPHTVWSSPAAMPARLSWNCDLAATVVSSLRNAATPMGPGRRRINHRLHNAAKNPSCSLTPGRRSNIGTPKPGLSGARRICPQNHRHRHCSAWRNRKNLWSCTDQDP
jgi:NADPH:quinone reductase-like Zn-dependent oxidoreductase